MDERIHRARRAYELGFLRDAAVLTAPALLMAALGWMAGFAHAAPVGLVLCAAVLGLAWRGGDARRGAMAGLRGGAFAYAALMAWSTVGVCGGPSCLVATVTSAALASVVVVHAARSLTPGWVAAALGIASLTAALPCVIVGAAGALVVPAVWVTGLPLVAWRRWSIDLR